MEKAKKILYYIAMAYIIITIVIYIIKSAYDMIITGH